MWGVFLYMKQNDYKLIRHNNVLYKLLFILDETRNDEVFEVCTVFSQMDQKPNRFKKQQHLDCKNNNLNNANR